MTTETTNPKDESDELTQWDPVNDADGYTLDDVRSKDWFLDTVLNFVHGFNDETPGGFVGLTVTSNGVLVSGLAISLAEWITVMVELYKQAGADETADHVRTLFTQAHNGVLDQAKARDEADLPSLARGFLHMKDVRIGVGNVTTQVPLWRGSLADITGWSLGSWNPKQDENGDE